MSELLSGRTRQLILVPAVITLAVTLLRLVGELQNWSPTLFSREPGAEAP
jgi:CHASE2 domain-containing sensor protein